jgi:hypothetical protein
MQQQNLTERLMIVRSISDVMLMAGSQRAESAAMKQMLGASAPRGSIERTNAGLWCVRTRLVVPPRLAAASQITRDVVTRIGRSQDHS